MRTVLLSGASGLIGSAVQERFKQHGRDVKVVRRKQSGWELPTLGEFDLVHLAGKPLAMRWTEKSKSEIRESRVEMTHRLLHTLPHPPTTIVSASGVGFYGCRGDEQLTESSGMGTGFLPSICMDWESATHCSARTVNLRFGLVLSPNGGALKKMLSLFRMGLGGKMGSGAQWWSWIAVQDAISAIEFCLDNDTLSGPVNAVSPNPVRNSEFTQLLAKKLRRPAIFGVPRFALKLALGQMAEETLLCSQRVVPQRLLENGFSFQFPSLTEAFDGML